mmetsp:Transcript_30314/g.59213  ORF Transcript_30314/g.59213 Transcript_30314/m.59213 type:complete len:339 (+) Transcript_30314:2008-3024(+)
MMTTHGSHTTQKKKFQKTTMAAKVPNVAIDGTSMMDVRHRAPMVVVVVTSIAAKARAQVHWRRPWSEPDTLLGCVRDCFHASMKTKTSSAPMPRIMKMTRTWMKVKLSFPIRRQVLSVRTNAMTIWNIEQTAIITDPTWTQMMMPTAKRAPIERSASPNKAWKKTGPIIGKDAYRTLRSGFALASASTSSSICAIHPSGVGSPVKPGRLYSASYTAACSSSRCDAFLYPGRGPPTRTRLFVQNPVPPEKSVLAPRKAFHLSFSTSEAAVRAALTPSDVVVPVVEKMLAGSLQVGSVSDACWQKGPTMVEKPERILSWDATFFSLRIVPDSDSNHTLML